VAHTTWDGHFFSPPVSVAIYLFVVGHQGNRTTVLTKLQRNICISTYLLIASSLELKDLLPRMNLS
jgi:hypothetical protein